MGKHVDATPPSPGFPEFVPLGNRQEKGKVCFGSGLERQTLERDTRGMVSRHARANLKEINEIVGPGSYDLSQTSTAARVMNKPTSKRGTVLGGRTSPRTGAFTTGAATPAPGAYDIPTTFAKEFRYKQACAPFNSLVERGKEASPSVPGVGIYNVAPHKRRIAPFAHSFGGNKCLLPAVKMKCGPFNFDTCERCQKFPEGDYWVMDIVEVENLSSIKKHKQGESEGIFLCRRCYDIEKKENKIFTKGQMRTFKKIRDCSKVHFHDGCKAKLFLVSPQEIAKVKEREAYMALYFN